MIVAEFEVTTTLSGRPRRVDVEVYDSQSSMLTANVEEGWDLDGAQGLTITRRQQDPAMEHIATIRLHRDGLTPYVIVHEATHAALKIYSVDFLYGKKKVKARATAHMNVFNEDICYLVGELSHNIIQAVFDAGLTVMTQPEEDDELEAA